MSRQKTFFVLITTLFCYIGLVVLCWIVLSNAAHIEAVVQLDHPDDHLQVYVSGKGDFNEQHSFVSNKLTAGLPQKVYIPLHQSPVQHLRLDLGVKPGRVQLQRLTLAGPFAQRRVLSPEEIFQLFRPDSPKTVLRLEQGFLEIQTHEDSYLVCTQLLLRPNAVLLWGIPLLFSLLLFLLLQQTQLAGLAPYADLRLKRPSIGENIDALDGLRALALLLVVADHTWGFFSGAGRSGVWIFMTLSGFLVAKPFIQEPGRICSPAFLGQFLLRRAKRIMPAYYTYIMLAFLLHGKLGEAALHFLFLKGKGHLWVVPQELIFYLLTPPVLLLCLLLGRIRPSLLAPGLLGMIVVATSVAKDVTLLGGLDEPLPLFFGVFLSGMLAAWLQYGRDQGCRQGLQLLLGTKRAAVLAVLILLFFVLFSHERAWGGTRFLALLYYPWYAAAAALLIMAVLKAQDSLLLRFLSSLPLRALSLVSFSLYLFHPLILDLTRQGAELYLGIKHLSGAPLFFSVLVLSYLFSCCTYSLIERPFLRYSA